MTGDAAPRSRAGVVVPIRSFTGAKARLADFLDEDARAAALRQMAARVIDAAAPMTVIVVTSAAEVREWALARGVDVVEDPGSLDEAAAAGTAALEHAGFARAVIAHADLPLARSLAPLARDLGRPIAAFVPCHRDDGTNVLSLPTGTPFRFAYGPGSFRRHVAEARRLALGTRVVRAPDLAVDVDAADDLHYLDDLNAPCVSPCQS